MFKKIIFDIKNYCYIKKQIKLMKKESKWNELLLRNSGCKIYTVRTLNAEYFGEKDELIKKHRINEMFEPVFEWLLQWNLQDVMKPEFPMLIPNSISHLLIIKPMYAVLTILNFTRIILYLLMILLIILITNYIF